VGFLAPIHWQVARQMAPFIVKGKKVKLKGTTFVASPGNHTEISEGDDPFANLGTFWVQPQGLGAAARSVRGEVIASDQAKPNKREAEHGKTST
jgi:hypothetical protein